MAIRRMSCPSRFVHAVAWILAIAGCGSTEFIEVPGSNVRIELGANATYRVSLDPEYRVRHTSYELLVKRGPFDPLAAAPPASSRIDGSGGRLYLVQFFTPPLAEYRAHLATLGARSLSFFPHNAHIMEMSAAAAAASPR